MSGFSCYNVVGAFSERPFTKDYEERLVRKKSMGLILTFEYVKKHADVKIGVHLFVQLLFALSEFQNVKNACAYFSISLTLPSPVGEGVDVVDG